MAQVYDLSDPAKPVKIRDFGLVGQQPGATGAVPPAIHGLVSTGPKGNRIYLAYGTNKGGIIQIVDREKLLKGPKEPTPENLLYPQVGRLDMPPLNGGHTAMPLGKFKIAGIRQEKEGAERDIRDGRERDVPRGMRRGAADGVVRGHNDREPSRWSCRTGPCRRRAAISARAAGASARIPRTRASIRSTTASSTFITFFNAGVRVLDIRNPYEPKEVGYFIPPITKATQPRCGMIDGQQRCSNTVIQSNNAEADDRGYIYVADRANTGLHILELTGEPRTIAGLPPHNSPRERRQCREHRLNSKRSCF